MGILKDIYCMLFKKGHDWVMKYSVKKYWSQLKCEICGKQNEIPYKYWDRSQYRIGNRYKAYTFMTYYGMSREMLYDDCGWNDPEPIGVI